MLQTEIARRARNRDRDAADLVRRLRLNEGFNHRELSIAIAEKGVRVGGFDRSRVSVSPDTLYLIERTHREPGPRIKFAISFYFDLRPGQIWKRDALGYAAEPVAGVR
jgi:hypothetical protein